MRHHRRNSRRSSDHLHTSQTAACIAEECTNSQPSAMDSRRPGGSHWWDTDPSKLSTWSSSSSIKTLRPLANAAHAMAILKTTSQVETLQRRIPLSQRSQSSIQPSPRAECRQPFSPRSIGLLGPQKILRALQGSIRQGIRDHEKNRDIRRPSSIWMRLVLAPIATVHGLPFLERLPRSDRRFLRLAGGLASAWKSGLGLGKPASTSRRYASIRAFSNWTSALR